MISKIGKSAIDFSQLENDLRSIRGKGSELISSEDTGASKGTSDFAKMLSDSLKEVNSSMKESEKASMDLVSGKSTNLHEAMLSATKAELGFNLLVQMRNKALEAYQEVMRMQV